MSKDASERVLKDALNGSKPRLILPAVEIRSVVGDPQRDVPRHSNDGTGRLGPEQLRVVGPVPGAIRCLCDELVAGTDTEPLAKAKQDFLVDLADARF